MNHKKLFRLYREEKLAVRRRSGRKRAIGTRAPMLIPLRPYERWSLDSVSDQLAADTSLSGARVARELDRLIIERGKPGMIVSDNGSEFTSNAILGWAEKAKEPAPAKEPVKESFVGRREQRRACEAAVAA